MTQNMYGLIGQNSAPTFSGVAGTLPGASAMTAGVVVRFTGNAASNTIFSNLSGGNGWGIGYSYANGQYSVVITIQGNTFTQPIGSVRGSWMFIAFTITSTSLIVYVNGQRVGAVTMPAGVTASAGTPDLTIPITDTIGAAFYTESVLDADKMAGIFSAIELFVGLDSLVSSMPLQHLYEPQTSERPRALVFEDTGSVGGVDLTVSALTNLAGVILPGDFGQPGATGAAGATA